MLNRDGQVVAFVVGKLEKHPGIGIGVPGRDIKRFLAYYGVSAPLARNSQIDNLLRDWSDDDQPMPNVNALTVRVRCK